MNILSLDSILKRLPPALRDLVEYGFCRNRWGWAHGLAGAICGKLGGIFAPWWVVMPVALVIAIAWEIWEYRYVEFCRPKSWFYFDSAGDIILALVLCGLTL